jgi:hypothetical protein
MKKALRAYAIGDGTARVGRATQLALIARGLCDEGQQLTDTGRVAAVGLLPLVLQCQILGLPLRIERHQWTGSAEAAAMGLLTDESEWVLADEGKTIHAVIHGLVLPRLYAIASEAWSDCGGADRARSYLYLHYAGYLHILAFEPRLTDLMLDDIQNATVDRFQHAWSTLRAWNRTFGSHPAAHLSADRATEFLQSIGRRTLFEIASRAFENPYAFWCGWPDLTLRTKTGRVQFLEVKATDRLHASQVVLLPMLRESIGLDVSVLQLKRIK